MSGNEAFGVPFFQRRIEWANRARLIVVLLVLLCVPQPVSANDGPQFRSMRDIPDGRCAYDEQCDDGLYCNGAEQCIAGECVAGSDPCTGRTCFEDTDTCAPCQNHAECDDGLYCNGTEWCDLVGECQPGEPPDCTDAVMCTVDLCDETAECCTNTPDDSLCDDGIFCNGGETCDPLGGCQPGSEPCDAPECPHCDEDADRCAQCVVAAHCDDGVYCNGAESCDPTGTCQMDTPRDCDDGIACTVDLCDELGARCRNVVDDDLCRDESACTVDRCNPASIDANADGCCYGLLPCDDLSDCPVETVACAHGVCLCMNGPIPAVTTWGLLVMTLLGLIAGTIIFRRPWRETPRQRMNG